MFRRFLSNKFFLVGGSLVALLALGVVLGLVVVRVQNQRATVTQPKAAGSEGNCTGTLTHWYYDNKSDCTKPRVTDPCNAPCFWDPPTCYNSANTCWCPADPSVYKPFDCSTIKDEATCVAKDNGISGYVSSKREACRWNTSFGGCWVNVPIPKSWAPTGQISGTTPTFSWDYDTTYSSNVTGVAVYLYDTNPGPTTAAKWSAFGQSGSFKSATLSQFGVNSLQPNTQYWWLVVTNSYAPPEPKYACMKVQSFTTGSATTGQTHLACQNSACVAVAGAGNNTDGCTAAGQACTTTSTCTLDSDCTSGKVCAEGSCVDPSQSRLGCGTNKCVRKKGAGNNTDGCTAVDASCTTAASHFECVNKACASVAGAGDNKNGCTSAGGSCCSSNSDCTTGLSCDTTKTPNACSTASEVSACWGNGGTSGKCYDCNGDGEINTLDFSCFRKLYLKNV